MRPLPNVVCRTGLLLGFLALTACREPGSGIVHCWQVNQIRQEGSGYMAAFPDFRKPATLKGCFLRFYADGSAVVWQKKQGYSVHRWAYSEEQDSYWIRNPATGTKLRFRVADADGHSLKLAELTDNHRETGLHMRLSITQLYEDGQTDLLRPDLNVWRNAPNHSENPVELKKRVEAMLEYVIRYFELVERRGQTYFETPILQSPFRFYSGGIGLTSEKELPPEWAQTFYNRQEAVQAYRMLVKAFNRDVTYPKGTKRYTEAYLKVLYGVRTNLKK